MGITVDHYGGGGLTVADTNEVQAHSRASATQLMNAAGR